MERMMVRKTDKLGGTYHEPPYTTEEEMELYKRMGSGPKTIHRGARSTDPPKDPEPVAETAQPQAKK